MITFNKVPSRMPTTPALVREGRGLYAIWTGRSWHGHIERSPRAWLVVTPGKPPEVCATIHSARHAALDIALRAEGRLMTTERVAAAVERVDRTLRSGDTR